MKTLLLVPLTLLGCQPEAPPDVTALVARHGCGTCHVIPGIPGANGRTGPPLTDYARQVYVAGVAPNDLATLAAFIRSPRGIDPRSAMPDLGLGENEARRLADYLSGEP